jgi:hypothetical protein
MGSTGDSPVPSGDSPDGMTAARLGSNKYRPFLKITWGGQVREKPLHLTPYDYFEQEQAKQKAKSTASQC